MFLNTVWAFNNPMILSHLGKHQDEGFMKGQLDDYMALLDLNQVVHLLCYFLLTLSSTLKTRRWRMKSQVSFADN